VALGAAVQADILEGGVKDMLLLDVTPLSLGTRRWRVVQKSFRGIPRFPRARQELFTTGVENQTGIDIHVSRANANGEGLPFTRAIPIGKCAGPRGARAH